MVTRFTGYRYAQFTCRSKWQVYPRAALPETNLRRQAATEGTTGPTDSRERVAGATVGHRVHVLLAVHLQNEGAFAALLDDHCMLSRFNKQYDYCAHMHCDVDLRSRRMWVASYRPTRLIMNEDSHVY